MLIIGTCRRLPAGGALGIGSGLYIIHHRYIRCMCIGVCIGVCEGMFILLYILWWLLVYECGECGERVLCVP